MRSSLVIGLYLGSVAITLAGCNSAPGNEAVDAPVPSSSTAEAARAGVDVESLPKRFGYGRAADAAEIAALDIDVGPDGTGLPPAQGTVSDGALVYATQCASCHGAQGEGTPIGNRLVGTEPIDVTGWNRTIGNYWPYAPTIFDYIRRAMPFDRPGSLNDDDVYAVTAYLLHLNEIIPPDAVMDAQTLPQVEMPARGRFVLDDREASTKVR